MHFFQALNLVTVMVDTLDWDSKINIELENATYLRITWDGLSRYFMFKKNVIWPGIIRIEDYGVIDVVLRKEEKGIWERDVANPNLPVKFFVEGLKTVNLPDYYETKVIEKITVSPEYNILRLIIVNKKLYSRIGPGQMVDVKHCLEGDNFDSVHPYVTVPILPITNYSYPNPKPGDWFDSDFPTNLLVRRRENRDLDMWLFNREVNDTVLIGNPNCNFTTKWLHGTRYLYLASKGVGTGTIISILLYILQTTTATKVFLGIFEDDDNNLFWQSEIRDIVRFDKRLHVQYLTNYSFDTINQQLSSVFDRRALRGAFPKLFKTADHAFLCVAGDERLVEVMKLYNKDFFHLPDDRYHIFKEATNMFKPIEKKRLPVVDFSDYSLFQF